MVMEWIESRFIIRGIGSRYQVALCGGIDMLSNPGGDSIVTPWEKIVRYDPEVLLVIVPCGFHIGRAKKEWNGIIRCVTEKRNKSNCGR